MTFQELIDKWRQWVSPEPPMITVADLISYTPMELRRNEWRAGYAEGGRRCAAELHDKLTRDFYGVDGGYLITINDHVMRFCPGCADTRLIYVQVTEGEARLCCTRCQRIIRREPLAESPAAARLAESGGI